MRLWLSGVVFLDEHCLRGSWPMWELGVMMTALPAEGQQHPGSAAQAARAVLPVFLMPVDAVTATYRQHWTPAAVQEALSKGRQPVTLEDLERLLDNMGSRQEQVRLLSCPPAHSLMAIIIAPSRTSSWHCMLVSATRAAPGD